MADEEKPKESPPSEEANPGASPPKEGAQPPPSGGPSAGAQPSEEELRRQLEDEIAKLRVEDVLLQSVASLINLSARRIAKEDERDLEQARVGIDAVRAVVDLLPDEPAEQVRGALSELQMLYAREAGDGDDSPQAEEKGEEAAKPEPPKKGGGKGKRGPGLWTPPGT